MTKFTQKTLEAITPDKHGETIREDGGLFGRIRANSNGISISFYYRYRWQSKTRDLSCGTWPTDSMPIIRKKRDDAKNKVANGIDPGEQKKVKKIEIQEAMLAKIAEHEKQRREDLTVTDLFNAWIDNGVRREDGNAVLKRTFSVDALPYIGTIKVSKLTEADLISVLRRMVERGVNRSAVLMNNSFKQMFSWAEKRQPWRKLMIEGNPADLVEIDNIVSPDYDMDNIRSRILSDHEIFELNMLLQIQEMKYENASNRRSAERPVVKTTQLAFWIMLSTICRVGELSMSRWKHVDFESKTWLIPKKNVKNKVSAIVIYLSDYALYYFKKLYEITGYSDWCFPDSTGENCIGRKVIADQISDRQVMFKLDADGNPACPKKNRKNDNSLVLGRGENGKWTPHDLRRTGSTIMQRLNIPLVTINRCQNHVVPGEKVNRHYLHHDYARETKEAWDLLGDYLGVAMRGDDTEEFVLSNTVTNRIPM
ncbi:tyrosine-type recombinase/integrase [Undibacterium sp. Dicai25W]|uniref:tyrosine-type recombinase/integrase n=1 Tax=Undibacterium sp. Dicai25W TaxID=3413034 RepID=UPI003BF0761F